MEMIKPSSRRRELSFETRHEVPILTCRVLCVIYEHDEDIIDGKTFKKYSVSMP